MATAESWRLLIPDMGEGLDIDDLVFNELRKYTEFLYAQYQETKDVKEKLTVFMMNLNSELY